MAVPKKIARSVELSSKSLDLIAKIDLVESANGKVVPVDYKRGKRPQVPRRAYDPEWVRLCAQGLPLIGGDAAPLTRARASAQAHSAG